MEVLMERKSNRFSPTIHEQDVPGLVSIPGS